MTTESRKKIFNENLLNVTPVDAETTQILFGEIKRLKMILNGMTKEECLRIMRLLSALESIGVIERRMPDYLGDEIAEAINILEREILK